MLARLSERQTELVSQTLTRLARGRRAEARNLRLTRELAGSRDRIQEIHHRVRNHLQAVSGLLSMHEARETSPGARQALRQGIARLTAVAAIHDMLARDPESGELRLPELARRLTRHLLMQAGAEGRVHVHTQVAEVSLGAKEAVAAVLVLTELVSNAIEHGFPGEAMGEISIRLTVATGAGGAQQATLVIQDTGPGLCEGFHVGEGGGTGLKLVRRLVERDLQGSITARNAVREHETISGCAATRCAGGACFRVDFPLPSCGSTTPPPAAALRAARDRQGDRV